MSRFYRLDRPVSLGHELLAVVAAGEGGLPQRRGGQARDRVLELTSLIAGLVGEDGRIEAPAYRKSLEARAPASVKALANDLACYSAFCARAGGLGLRSCTEWPPLVGSGTTARQQQSSIADVRPNRRARA